MSTYKLTPAKCACCKEGSVQTQFTSASAFDEPDLDFRPAEMMRSTLGIWLMHCPRCGYVAKDIRKKPGVKKEALHRLYQNIDLNLPLKAQDFIKYAFLCEAKKDWRGAVEGYLWTAWLCDDDNDNEHAKAMRIQCLKALDQRLQHFLFPKEWRYNIQLKADLLRRTEDAANIKALMQMDTDDRRLDFITRELLLYQKTLAGEGDFGAHCRSEIDLDLYDDFFERKRSVKRDLFFSLDACLAKAVSPVATIREEALADLDDLRPVGANLAYHELHDILLFHRGKPLDEDHPFVIKELAQIADEELLDVLEGFVVSHDTLREDVTEQNQIAMALLYQLYTSTDLKEELKNYKNAKERLYVMAVEPPFGEDRSYVGLIEPFSEEVP